MTIAVIVGTTRQGRVTPRLAKWVMQAAQNRSDAQFKLLDLKDYDIPLLNDAPWEANRRLTQGTRQWLGELQQADGIIIVTAEYNHTIPAVLKNAFDQTHGELIRKPVAIVSHGVNSGVRANEHLRQMLNSNMGSFAISATVTYFGKVTDSLDEQGNSSIDNQLNDDKLQNVLNDIIWYTKALTSAKQQDIS
ncbi:MAG: NAD(P)H-dependent oxidoreductase [Candidatus Saccharimonadales bacterium]